MSPRAAGAHALVIGGSMAGMWAARVLADRFERVTILERDALPRGPEIRRGAPQARHVHVLLTRGQRLLEAYFPGLDAALAAEGAPAVCWTRECAIHGKAGWSPSFSSDLISRTCSRELLEWQVRRRLARRPEIEIRDRVEVTGLLADPAGRAIRGVSFRLRGGSDAEQELHADLVVDASGRSSRFPRWLEALGYEAPAESRVSADLGYATRRYRRPPAARPWKSMLVLGHAPDQPRGGVIYPVENGGWIVTLAGTAGHHPGTDETGFDRFLRRLPVPDFRSALLNAEPTSPIWGYRRTGNRLRYVERLSRWPDRLIVMGDALCAFNPVYGQGMTVAGLGAAELGRELDRARALDGVARRTQVALARINRTPWLLATNEDMRWSAPESPPRGLEALGHGYVNRLLDAVAADPVVSRGFWGVTHLVEPLSALFRPGVAVRVVAHALRQRVSRPTLPQGHR